jgi:hypothetical protein
MGVLLRAKRLGLVGPIAPLLEQLQSGGIGLSNAMVAMVLEVADER